MGAEIKVSSRRVFSAEDGRFRLGEVDPDRSVAVSAPTYQTQRLRPSESLLVRLSKLESVVAVTSSLTGEGVLAKFDGPFTVEEEGNGIFRIYGAGPGDSLHVSAFAHEPAEIRIDDGGRAKVVLQATRVDPAAIFSLLKGFLIENVPPNLRQVQGQLEGRIRADPQYFEGSNPVTAVRLLGQGTNGAVVMAVAVEPSFMAKPQVLANFAQSLAAGTRSAAQQRIIEGKIAYVGDSEGGFKWVAFDTYSVLFAVFGTDDLFVEGVTKSIKQQLR